VIVGRADTVAALDRALAAVEDGRAVSVLLVGEPGMGATTLLEHLRESARGRGTSGTTWRTGACSAPHTDDDIPFALVHDLLTSLLTGRGPTQPAHDQQVAMLEPALPTPGSMSTVLVDAVDSLAQRRPVLLTVDDLQWADEASASTLALLAQRLVDQRVALVGATRPPVPDRFATWTVVELPPLGPEHGLRLLRQVSEYPVDAWAGEAAVRAWGGNPQAIVTCHRLLTPDQLAGRHPIPDPPPLSAAVRQVWAPMITALPPGARRALEVVSVLDVSRIGLVSRVLADLGCSLADVEAGRRARLVVTGPHGAPVMAHPLLRATVLTLAPTERLRAAHRTIAEVAAREGAPRSVVVSHLHRSAAPGDETIVDLLADQARRAVEDDEQLVAARAWHAAADITTDEHRRREMALSAARGYLTQTTGTHDMAGLLDTLRHVHLSAPDQAWLEWLRAEVLADSDLRASAAAALAAATHAADSHPTLVPWLLWDAAASAWSADAPDVALDAARRLDAWSRRAADRVAPGWLPTAVLGVALLEAGEPVDGAQLLRRARRSAVSWSPSAETALGELINVVALDDLVGVDDGRRDWRVQELVTRLRAGRDATLAAALVQAGWCAIRRGDLAAAAHEGAQARDLARAVQATPERIAALCLLAEVEARVLPVEEGTSTLTELRTLAARVGHRRALAEADRCEGLRLLAEGRLDSAEAALERVHARHLRGRSARDALVAGRVDLVEAYARGGRSQEAAEVLREVTPTLGALADDDPFASGLADRATALVAASRDLPQALVRACAAFAAAGDEVEQARTCLLHAEYLRRHHRPAAAREQARRAVRLLDETGASAWLERAQDEAECGERSSDQGRTVLDGLTTQERHVAEAVCAGGTTREVADSLSLSPRTVEFHLGNAYRKLGVHNRAQLVNLLHAHAAPEAVDLPAQR
jgi:DNA-binding CsgD family transcriptional regulator